MKKIFLFLLLYTVLFSYGYSQITKRVLLEEASYASCAQCPEGAYWMDSITTEFPNVVGVTHHIFQDSMTIQQSIDWAADMSAGAPLANIDRVDFEDNGTTYELTTQWRNKVIQQLAITADVDLVITGDWNTTTRDLSFSVISEFDNTVTSGDLRLNVFLVEDSVIGTGIGYDQANIYNTQSGHPYFGAGDPIVGFVHRHVVRYFITGTWGDSTIIPSTPVVSTPYTGNYTYNVPNKFDEAQLSLVAFISYYNNDITQREVLNTVEVKLNNLVSSVPEANSPGYYISIYPNPSTDIIYFSERVHYYKLFDGLGQVVDQGNGVTQINLSDLKKGMYYILLKGSDNTFSKLMVK